MRPDGEATVAPIAATYRSTTVLISTTRPFGRWSGRLGPAVSALSFVMVVLLMGPLAGPLILIWVLAASIEIVRTRAQAVAAGTPGEKTRGHPAQVPMAR